MSLQLIVVTGPDKGQTFNLFPGPDMVLGRGSKATYALTDARASRSHCQVLLEGETPVVICQGGSGGTFVNGKPVQRQALKLGDVLKVGETELRLQLGDTTLATAREILGANLGATAAEPPDAAQAESLEKLAGSRLSHYDIGPVIGEGSTSRVFHATDTVDGKSVALKVLLPAFARDEDEVQRFIRAMKTMLPLRHPNLVTVHGAGKTGPFCWVAMEYVAGENLNQAIGRLGIAGTLDWRHAYRVAVHVARALGYAHEHQVIHRNVTPKNILMDAPTKTAKLGDLMKAKALEGVLAKQITRPGELVGDVLYMAPERTGSAADADGRSDLYGLGATVYALLTGRPPFEGASLVEKITRIRRDEPVKPTKYQMSIPSGFEGAVLKLLAKRPEDRYQTAAELLKELERIGKLHGVTA